MTPSDFAELRAIVLDPTLGREQRLLAFWRLSARHWQQRTMRSMYAEVVDQDDKMVTARKNHNSAALLRRKAANIAKGSNRIHKITGTMTVNENADRLHNHICEVCGVGFSPNKPHTGRGRAPQYCSAACRQVAYRQRRAA